MSNFKILLLQEFLNQIKSFKFLLMVALTFIVTFFTRPPKPGLLCQAGREKGLEKVDYYNLFRSIGLQDEAFERKFKKFSKGMRQKVGLAIAIVKDADNILLDEPTSGLDPKATAEFMSILKKLRNEGKSILICSHDIFWVKEIADKVGIMKEGRLAILRTREQLSEDDLEKIYLDYMQGAHV